MDYPLDRQGKDNSACAEILNIPRQYRKHLCTDSDNVCLYMQFALNNRYLLYIQVDNLVVPQYILINMSMMDYRWMKHTTNFGRMELDNMGQLGHVEVTVSLIYKDIIDFQRITL